MMLPAMLGIARPSVPADLDVKVGQDDGFVVIHARAVIDADAGRAWRVLTDYARYPEFMPGVRDSRVVRRDGASVTVAQTGVAFLGVVHIPVAVVYAITESPPDNVWSTAKIGTLGNLYSHYVLAPDGPRVHLEYTGRLALRPDALRSVEEVVARRAITRQFQALVDEIEHPGAGLQPGERGG